MLTSAQKRWLKKYFKNNNIHLKISNLEGLAYLLKTGCQWRLLPEYYGARQTIYYHFRTLGDKDVFSKIKQKLLEIKRITNKMKQSPSIAVIDSQSVRSGLSKSEKGIFTQFTNYGRICVYDAFIKAYLANRIKSIIYARGRYLCTDIHWHLRPCLTVMWLATRPYKHEQICSMTARLCFNIYYETGSY